MASRMVSLPRKAKDRLLTPAMTRAPFRFCFRYRTVSMKSTAKWRCSSIPVPTASTLGSRIISWGSKPACSTSIRKARVHISMRRSRVDACPCSSKAMTSGTAPYCLISFAFRKNAPGPSFRLIEFTMDLPWTHCKPASSTSQREESSISGTLATSGSEPSMKRNSLMAVGASSIGSSMLTSSICAPSRTIPRAISNAWSYCFSLINLANLRLPDTLVRSPAIRNAGSSRTVSISRPLRVIFCTWLSSPLAVTLLSGAWFCRTILATASMCSGVVPQQPPIILTSPSST